MALAQEDIEFIKRHLGEWLAEQSLGKPPAVYEIELRERMVRVEEELKHQRELMREGFDQIDRRFEAMQANIDRRFEQVDKRFEAMQLSIDKRFEQVDRRFEQVDKRFEQMDRRFDEMLKRHDRHFLWLVGFIASSAGLVIGTIKFL
jgi:ABC-type phosphate transport system auxiliary subunit